MKIYVVWIDDDYDFAFYGENEVKNVDPKRGILTLKDGTDVDTSSGIFAIEGSAFTIRDDRGKVIEAAEAAIQRGLNIKERHEAMGRV